VAWCLHIVSLPLLNICVYNNKKFFIRKNQPKWMPQVIAASTTLKLFFFISTHSIPSVVHVFVLFHHYHCLMLNIKKYNKITLHTTHRKWRERLQLELCKVKFKNQSMIRCWRWIARFFVLKTTLNSIQTVQVN
jgi:hypothetical protein